MQNQRQKSSFLTMVYSYTIRLTPKQISRTKKQMIFQELLKNRTKEPNCQGSYFCTNNLTLDGAEASLCGECKVFWGMREIAGSSLHFLEALWSSHCFLDSIVLYLISSSLYFTHPHPQKRKKERRRKKRKTFEKLQSEFSFGKKSFPEISSTHQCICLTKA